VIPNRHVRSEVDDGVGQTMRTVLQPVIGRESDQNRAVHSNVHVRRDGGDDPQSVQGWRSGAHIDGDDGGCVCVHSTNPYRDGRDREGSDRVETRTVPHSTVNDRVAARRDGDDDRHVCVPLTVVRSPVEPVAGDESVRSARWVEAEIQSRWVAPS